MFALGQHQLGAREHGAPLGRDQPGDVIGVHVGGKQRVNVAQATIAGPGFLLLDEPTASLDQKTKDTVIDLFLELKARGTSIVLITHDQHTLERMSDRRLHLAAGRVEELATA